MSTSLPRIASVQRIGPTTLGVAWQSSARDRADASDRVDLAGWIATGGEVLTPLKDEAVFSTARLGAHGASVEWGDPNGDLAIDAHHLRQLANEQRAFAREDVVAWQEQIHLSNQEAADFLDVSLSSWNTYKAGTSRMPAAMAIACSAALRDPVVLQAHYRPRKTGRPRRITRAQA